jgi:uncharacterized protein (DUF2236 family)
MQTKKVFIFHLLYNDQNIRWYKFIDLPVPQLLLQHLPLRLPALTIRLTIRIKLLPQRLPTDMDLHRQQQQQLHIPLLTPIKHQRLLLILLRVTTMPSQIFHKP